MEKLPKTVSEVMTRDVYSIDENDQLANLLEAMKSLGVRHIPVTDGDHLVGLVTERDLLRISTSTLLPNYKESDAFLKKTFHVRDVMQTEVTSVQPETPLLEAGRILHRQRIGCLPIVDSNNVLLGILTEADFVNVVVSTLAGSVG